MGSARASSNLVGVDIDGLRLDWARLSFFCVCETPRVSGGGTKESLKTVLECNWLAPQVLILVIRVQVPVEPSSFVLTHRSYQKNLTPRPGIEPGTPA